MHALNSPCANHVTHFPPTEQYSEFAHHQCLNIASQRLAPAPFAAGTLALAIEIQTSARVRGNQTRRGKLACVCFSESSRVKRATRERQEQIIN